MIPSITSIVILAALVSYSIELPMPAGMDDNGPGYDDIDVNIDNVEEKRQDAEVERETTSRFGGPKRQSRARGRGRGGRKKKRKGSCRPGKCGLKAMEAMKTMEVEEKRQDAEEPCRPGKCELKAMEAMKAMEVEEKRQDAEAPCAMYDGPATDHCFRMDWDSKYYGCCGNKEDLFEYSGLCKHNIITCFGLKALEKKKRS